VLVLHCAAFPRDGTSDSGCYYSAHIRYKNFLIDRVADAEMDLWRNHHDIVDYIRNSLNWQDCRCRKL
jgi:hypothetical protein